MVLVFITIDGKNFSLSFTVSFDFKIITIIAYRDFMLMGTYYNYRCNY